MKRQILYLVIVFSASKVFAQMTNVPLAQEGNHQSETAVAVSPLNVNYLMAGWNDIISGSQSKMGYAFSTDGGINWAHSTVRPFEGGSVNQNADPSVAFDRFGNAFLCYYYASSATNKVIYVSRTTNLGADWSHEPLDNNPGGRQDKPYMAVDNRVGANGNIYVSWAEFDASPSQAWSAIKFAVSTNHGVSFLSPITLDSIFSPVSQDDEMVPRDPAEELTFASEAVHTSMPAVGPNGHVYVVWKYFTAGANASRIRLRKSTDGGTTFGGIFGSIPFTHLHEYVGGASIHNIPCLACDPVTGYLYIVIVDRDPVTSQDVRIRFLRSTDDGVSWSSTVIADFGGIGWQFFPWVSVESTGRVSVAFMYKGTSGPLVDAYIIESHDRGTTFTPPVRVSDQSTDANIPGGFGHHYMGGAAMPGGRVNVVWTDYRNTIPTRNQDPYFSIANAPPAAPQSLVVANNGAPPNNNPRLNWNRNKETDLAVAPYKIWRMITGQEFFDWTEIATVSDTTYIDQMIGIYKPYVYTVYYKIKAVDISGNQSVFSNEVSIAAGGLLWKAWLDLVDKGLKPLSFELSQNHPNPFNPSTVIRYGIPTDELVTLKIYDVLGQEVATPVQEHQVAGWYEINLDATHFGNGVYFYRLQAGSFVQMKKMVLIK